MQRNKLAQRVLMQKKRPWKDDPEISTSRKHVDAIAQCGGHAWANAHCAGAGQW